MTRPLRVGLVGCGPRADTHLTALRAGGRFEPVALCDVDAERLAVASANHGIRSCYHSVADMVADEQLDLVDIVTPPGPRPRVLADAVDAGAPNVLLEKPIALTRADVAAARRLGQRAFLALNTQYRWMPHWQRVWELLASGALGELRSIRCSTRTNALEQGPHILDLALEAAMLAGAGSPEWILAGSSGAESFAEVEIPSEVIATIGLGEARIFWTQGPCSPVVPGEDNFWLQNQVEIAGVRGRVWISLNQGWELELDGHRERGATAWPADDKIAQSALFTELDRRIRDGTTDAFPTRIEWAADVADVIFAAVTSASERRRINL
jgi:predicted dehydrogenase